MNIVLVRELIRFVALAIHPWQFLFSSRKFVIADFVFFGMGVSTAKATSASPDGPLFFVPR